ncbi:MAG TPA: aldo/keto reductase [Acidimicrobiia bacterium]|jgi:aryl-alcohol dehydrogenase-like predicted oxidoreductase
MMEFRTIGSLRVSVVGLGCNNFGRHLSSAEADSVVSAAIDAGINFFDTADVYFGVEGASEVQLGQALRGRRDSVIVATKFGKPHPQGDAGWGGASPTWIRKAVEGSLRRLDTDYIDLYQLHEPDSRVPISETLGALNELVTAGKIREIGHANFSAVEIDEAERVAEAMGVRAFASTQVEWNLLNRTAELTVIDKAKAVGLRVLPYFPLASGLLTGKYFEPEVDPRWRLSKIPNRARFINDRAVEIARKLDQLARERGRTLLELALSWLAGQNVVASVIAGATTPEQVERNAVSASWRLDEELAQEIDAVTLGGDV